MSLYSEYFLNSRANVVQLELLEISHPNFTKIYRIVRNATDGVIVKLEDGTRQVFDYYPLKIQPSKTSDDLDCVFKIDLGDLGQILPQELDTVALATNAAYASKSTVPTGFSIKPVVKYRTYRSDDLSKPLFGPLILEIKNLSFGKAGVSFEAKAPSLNVSKTGELYKIDRFPMLRGFL
jgi:hypothetical protein